MSCGDGIVTSYVDRNWSSLDLSRGMDCWRRIDALDFETCPALKSWMILVHLSTMSLWLSDSSVALVKGILGLVILLESDLPFWDIIVWVTQIYLWIRGTSNITENRVLVYKRQMMKNTKRKMNIVAHPGYKRQEAEQQLLYLCELIYSMVRPMMKHMT